MQVLFEGWEKGWLPNMTKGHVFVREPVIQVPCLQNSITIHRSYNKQVKNIQSSFYQGKSETTILMLSAVRGLQYMYL
jgi:hypothetical protein